MTDLEQLRANLEKAKQDLEAKGYKLGEKGEFMDLIPAMKQYEFRFQDAIEQVWPDKAWWQMTNYWDIFQNSIMSGKSADEVIEDIINHIVVKEEEPAPVEKPANEALEEPEVKVGTKIKIINMTGEPRYAGKEGTVEYIDSIGQLHGTWGGCAVIPEEDQFEVINEQLDEAEEAEEPAPEANDNEEDVKVSDTLFTLFSSKGE